MIRLLYGMNKARKELMEQGVSEFPKEKLEEYRQEYAVVIAKGREENKKTAHRYAKREETALLNRLEKYRHNHLLFLYDFSVPFENNISERDLRKAKNRQKMAGGFRKESGHQMYCAILTIIETLKRRNMGILQNLKHLFTGTPAIF